MPSTTHVTPSLPAGLGYDLIVATAGYRTLSHCKRALTPDGADVATGGDMRQIRDPLLLAPWLSRG